MKRVLTLSLLAVMACSNPSTDPLLPKDFYECEEALILPESLDCSAVYWYKDRSYVVSRYPKKEKTQVSFVLLSEVGFTVGFI